MSKNTNYRCSRISKIHEDRVEQNEISEMDEPFLFWMSVSIK